MVKFKTKPYIYNLSKSTATYHQAVVVACFCRPGLEDYKTVTSRTEERSNFTDWIKIRDWNICHAGGLPTFV